MVVDLRDLDDPHDPLSGAWSGGYGQTGAGAGYDDLTLSPERYSAYPSGPDGLPAAGDSTERLPRVGEAAPADDALGVYGTPSHVAPGIPGLSGDADPVGHLRRPPGGRRLPAPVADVSTGSRAASAWRACARTAGCWRSAAAWWPSSSSSCSCRR